VELVLFCPSYDEGLWAVSAWNPRNNVNGSPDVPSNEVYTLKHPAIVDRQVAFVRSVVAALNRFDNVYYEICNEPYFGGVTVDWQARIASTIVDAEGSLPSRHLIAQNIANGAARVEAPLPSVSLLNFHYASPPGAVGLNYGLNRAIGDDETGFRGTGDFVYRAEAWEFLLAGGSLFSHLDYSFTADREDGTAEVVAPTPGGGGPAFRSQLAYLKRFVEGYDFLRMKPDPTVVVDLPPGIAAQVLAERGRAYAIYLRADPKEPTAPSLRLRLPDGRYRYEWHNPAEGGGTAGGRTIATGEPITLAPPPFRGDIALKIVAGE